MFFDHDLMSPRNGILILNVKYYFHLHIDLKNVLTFSYTKLCNHPQPSTTIHNHPQPSTTSHNHPQPSTITHNHPQPPKNYPEKPKLITSNHVTTLRCWYWNGLYWSTYATTQNHLQPSKTTCNSPQSSTTIHIDPQP